MGKKKNTEALVQILILIAIAGLLIFAMLSKKINYYVHPRFNIGIWGSIVVLILFAVSLIAKVKRARHNVRRRFARYECSNKVGGTYLRLFEC
jgi:putative membrane protein